MVELPRHGVEAIPAGSYFGEAPGEWARMIAMDRAAWAMASGATSVVTASPFDYHSLAPVMAARDLGGIAAERLRRAP
jgi:hypothetical protein